MQGEGSSRKDRRYAGESAGEGRESPDCTPRHDRPDPCQKGGYGVLSCMRLTGDAGRYWRCATARLSG